MAAQIFSVHQILREVLANSSFFPSLSPDVSAILSPEAGGEWPSRLFCLMAHCSPRLTQALLGGVPALQPKPREPTPMFVTEVVPERRPSSGRDPHSVPHHLWPPSHGTDTTEYVRPTLHDPQSLKPSPLQKSLPVPISPPKLLAMPPFLAPPLLLVLIILRYLYII